MQAVGQLADRNLADGLDFEKFDDVFDLAAMRDFLVERRAITQQLPEQPDIHLQRAPRHDVVERAHALEQRHVLEGAGDARGCRLVRANPRAPHALVGDVPFLREVEAVDAVQHRGLAGAVRADDGADLALPDVERYIRDRLHPAKAQGDILDAEQHLALGDAAGRGMGRNMQHHAAFPMVAAGK